MKFIYPSLVLLMLVACDSPPPPQSDSGAVKVSVTIPKDPSGMTMEQKNVADRLLLDNKPGSIKHLYIISAYSGQAIIYSTVKGKVTSSGKRLTPTSITDSYDNSWCKGEQVYIASTRMCTNEVLQDDGTYGSSVEYLYWWDVQGRYHQHYVSGGQIVHISDQPVPVKSVTINMAESK